MRSRYSAYVLGLEDYLLTTWHPRTRPERLGLADDAPVKWLELSVSRFEPGDEQAKVAFIARYKVGGRAFRLQETSRFLNSEGRWFYLDGDLSSA
ncbi:YchJ family protein [Chitiniphilus purpureus]